MVTHPLIRSIFTHWTFSPRSHLPIWIIRFKVPNTCPIPDRVLTSPSAALTLHPPAPLCPGRCSSSLPSPSSSVLLLLSVCNWALLVPNSSFSSSLDPYGTTEESNRQPNSMCPINPLPSPFNLYDPVSPLDLSLEHPTLDALSSLFPNHSLKQRPRRVPRQVPTYNRRVRL